MRLIQSGSYHSKILLCGEAPGADEDRIGAPFMGASGHELDSQLGLAGLNRSELFITNVVHERPPGNEIELFFARKSEAKRAVPLDQFQLASAVTALTDDVSIAVAAANLLDDESVITVIGGRYARLPILRGLLQLQRDINHIRPDLIIAMGNVALWALTGLTGILRWRGSILPANGGPIDGRGIKVIPTLHPAYVLREYAYRSIAIHDLARANRERKFREIRQPEFNFTVPTSVEEVRQWINKHITPTAASHPIVCDIENIILSGDLICIGFAVSSSIAICIPFMHKVGLGDDAHWWSDPAEEAEVIQLCKNVLISRPICFHNGLHDVQIIARNWGIMPRFEHDTMLAQHVAFPGMLGGKIDPISGKVDKKGSSLSLSFCASMHCERYRFWKLDGRGWDAEVDDEMKYYRYNCEDCVRTYESLTKQLEILTSAKLIEQYQFEMQLFQPVLQMMFRGINFDSEQRRAFKSNVRAAHKEIQAWINEAVGHDLNVGSSKQMQDLFYKDFQLPQILDRKTKQPTLNDKALDLIAKRSPVLKPLIDRIQTLRSLSTFEENFLSVNLSKLDNRLRGAFNVAGIETFRFSSNVNAFGEGFNLQNLPKPEE